jgi:hypothetical protein
MANVVKPRSNSDFIDTFFTWTEESLCAHEVTVHSVPPEVDTLDNIFETVESFVCKQGADHDDTAGGSPTTLDRNNSLLEECDRVQENLKVKKAQRRSVKPIGEEGDILDVAFNHLESYACGEKATGDLDLLAKSHMRASEVPAHEIDDEIQLFYRPNPRYDAS